MSRKGRLCMCLDEVSRFNLVAHKVRDAVSCKSIINGYLQKNAVLGSIAAAPQLL